MKWSGEGPARSGEERATPLELFFDLVFVLSFTQVTAKLAADPSWEGLGEGMLILAAVWWAWVAYGWLTNTVDVDRNLNRLAIFVAMAAMLIVSLSVPEAFGDLGLLFGCSYFIVRSMHLVLYIQYTRRGGDRNDLGAIIKLAPGLLLGSSLLILAGALDGGARTSVWIIALLIDYATPLLFGTDEFTLHPGHFAERYGLIVIIALGESLVAIGAGAGFDLNTGEVFAALLGIGAVACLWWEYFDRVAGIAERCLTAAPPGKQGPMARDAYSIIHLPLIAGIVLFAFGLKETLHGVDDPLQAVPAIALCGGAALYLGGTIAFRLRTGGALDLYRALAAGASLALIPLAMAANALVALVAVAAVLVALVAVEAVGSDPGPLDPDGLSRPGARA